MKSCSNYKAFRNNNNLKTFENIIFQYKGSKPSKNIIKDASDLFDSIISKGYVFRKNGKKAVMSACLYYTCIMNNVTRSPKNIASIMNIDEKTWSKGDKILQELNEENIIDIPVNYNPLKDYIKRFLSALHINEQYEQFIYDLILRAEEKNLHVYNESRTSTKCVGAIYLLVSRVKSLRYIKKNDISKECGNISKNTFYKYYQLLYNNHKYIKKTFKKHRIPMPLKWKNS